MIMSKLLRSVAGPVALMLCALVGVAPAQAGARAEKPRAVKPAKAVKPTRIEAGKTPAVKSRVKATFERRAATPRYLSKAKVLPRSNARRQARYYQDAPVAHLPELDASGLPNLRASSVIVADQASGEVLFQKNPDAVVPIASITKLMTAMVVLDARLSLAEPLVIAEEDLDILMGTRSRLPVGTELSREDMLRLALMSSENRASAALARNYPGGLTAFIAAMNHKARQLGLTDTHFADPTGLNPGNVSSARDLARMVAAGSAYPLIREFSTTREFWVVMNGRLVAFHNTNALVSNPEWEIGLSKTGFINKAGRCLVMQAWVNQKPTIIVLLDSLTKLSRISDAQRIKKWVEAAATVPASL